MITTDRQEFVGANTTPRVKEALKVKAEQEKTSVSMLIHRLLHKVLLEKAA